MGYSVISERAHAVDACVSPAPRSHAAAASRAGLPLMPTVASSWNDVRTPATNRIEDRTRPIFVTTITTVNVAALAKQGAPPRGEPR